MNAYNELPLLVFTILAQMAAGIIIAGQCLLYDLNANLNPGLFRRVRRQTVAALFFIALAAILSMLHLGTPLHSPFTIFHVGSSWLSREIIGVLLFGACLAVLAWMRLAPLCHKRENITSWIAVVLGLLLIFTMSQVYDSPLLPGWHSASTGFLFLATALITGGLWLGMAIAFRGFPDPEAATGVNSAWGRCLFLVFGGYILMATFLPFAMPRASFVNPASIGAAREQIAFWHSLHAALGGLGILTFLGAIWRAFVQRGGIFGPAGQARGISPAFNPLFIAFILALLGEACGRFAFYLSYARLGM